MDAKKILLIWTFWWINSLIWAQSVQHGQTLLYQGTEQKTPLQNVNINAAGAASVMSDANGEFSLNFRTLHAGDAIHFRRVELSGYEVMNTEALDAAHVARVTTKEQKSETTQEQTLSIVMIKRETLKELRDGYRSVAAQRYEKQLKATEEQLELLHKEGKLAEELYNARMDSLEADYEEKLSKLETYIDKFARIDLSDLDADEQKIISLVQAGEFDEALKIYDSQNLSARLKQSREDLSKLESARDKLAAAAQQKAHENERLMASIERHITLLLIAGGMENQMKVLKIRHEVFLADETNVKARREYAAVLKNIIGDYEKSNAILLEGVLSSENDVEKGQMMLEIAWNKTLTGEDTAVVEFAKQADSILWPLREKEYIVLTRSLPVLTQLYLDKIPFVGDDSVLPDYIQRLRDNWSPDYADPNSLANYVEVLASLTDYDSYQENHEQSLWDVREAIRLDSCLYALKPYLSISYQVYANAASTFAFEGKTDELQNAANKSISSILEFYPKVKETQEVTNLALSAYTLIEALVGAEYYTTADSIANIIDGIGLMERVQTKFPEVMDAFVGLYDIYRSQLHIAMGRVPEAQPLLEEGIQLLSKNENQALTAAYLKASSYAKREAALGNYEKAEALYKEAIEIQLSDGAEALSSWDKDNICHYYLGIADLYLVQGNTKYVKKYIKQAEKYASFELDKLLIEKRKKQ